MHQQIRSVPALSPPNLADFLKVLADAEASTSRVRAGATWNRAASSRSRWSTARKMPRWTPSRAQGYKPRLVEPKVCFLGGRAGPAARVHQRGHRGERGDRARDQGHPRGGTAAGWQDRRAGLLGGARSRQLTALNAGAARPGPPARRPRTARSARRPSPRRPGSATPSLSRMCVTWTAAVLRVMNSRSAISPLDMPAATSSSTSTSRADSPSAAAAARGSGAPGDRRSAATGGERCIVRRRVGASRPRAASVATAAASGRAPAPPRPRRPRGRSAGDVRPHALRVRRAASAARNRA